MRRVEYPAKQDLVCGSSHDAGRSTNAGYSPVIADLVEDMKETNLLV